MPSRPSVPTKAAARSGVHLAPSPSSVPCRLIQLRYPLPLADVVRNATSPGFAYTGETEMQRGKPAILPQMIPLLLFDKVFYELATGDRTVAGADARLRELAELLLRS